MKHILILFLFLQTSLMAQTIEPPALVKWYDIETAEKLFKKNPKPILIDVYTDWCSWCKYMMKTTFANPQIANYINNNYYAVRLNAESNDTIRFRDSVFTSFKSGKKYIQSLAYTLLDGRLSYPSFVYLDVKGRKTVIPGYLDIRKQEPLLYYFAENVNESTPYNYYERMFWFTYPNSYTKQLSELKENQKLDTLGVVHWLSPQEAFAKQKKNPKKIFIDFYATRVSSSNIMGRTNYRNSVIAKLLNENFYPVRFNVMSTDSFSIAGNKYINNTKQHPFHNFAVQFIVNQNKVKIPTMVFIDEKGKAITRLQEYLNPVVMEAFLSFISSDRYKTQNFQKFNQTFKHQLKY